MFRSIIKITGVLLVSLSLTGCATLSKEECQRGNWFQVGYTDGAEGQTIDRLNEHIKACADYKIAPDQMAYQQGRMQGVQQYCQTKGYSIGQKNQEYAWVCPKDLERKFLTDYMFGLKNILQETTLTYQQKQMDLNIEVGKMIALRESKDNKQINRIESLRNELRTLEQKQRDISGKINHVEHYLSTQ